MSTSVHSRPSAGAGAKSAQPVLRGQYNKQRFQIPWRNLPFTVVVGAIIYHCQVDHNGDNQSDEVDDEASQNHQGWTAGACAPGLVCLSRLVIADVHVCDGVGMYWRKALEKCRIRSLAQLLFATQGHHECAELAFRWYLRMHRLPRRIRDTALWVKRCQVIPVALAGRRQESTTIGCAKCCVGENTDCCARARLDHLVLNLVNRSALRITVGSEVCSSNPAEIEPFLMRVLVVTDL